jgi:hypothetical protein
MLHNTSFSGLINLCCAYYFAFFSLCLRVLVAVLLNIFYPHPGLGFFRAEQLGNDFGCLFIMALKFAFREPGRFKWLQKM